VRSLYESGDDLNWEDGARVSYPERLEPTAEVPSEEEENVVYGFLALSRPFSSLASIMLTLALLQIASSLRSSFSIRTSRKRPVQYQSYAVHGYAAFGQFLVSPTR
jgi:hypothetical protein